MRSLQSAGTAGSRPRHAPGATPNVCAAGKRAVNAARQIRATRTTPGTQETRRRWGSNRPAVRLPRILGESGAAAPSPPRPTYPPGSLSTQVVARFMLERINPSPQRGGWRRRPSAAVLSAKERRREASAMLSGAKAGRVGFSLCERRIWGKYPTRLASLATLPFQGRDESGDVARTKLTEVLALSARSRARARGSTRWRRPTRGCR